MAGRHVRRRVWRQGWRRVLTGAGHWVHVPARGCTAWAACLGQARPPAACPKSKGSRRLASSKWQQAAASGGGGKGIDSMPIPAIVALWRPCLRHAAWLSRHAHRLGALDVAHRQGAVRQRRLARRRWRPAGERAAGQQHQRAGAGQSRSALPGARHGGCRGGESVTVAPAFVVNAVCRTPVRAEPIEGLVQ